MTERERGEGGGEGETERETDRDRDRERQRQRDRDRDRETETEGRQRERGRGRETQKGGRGVGDEILPGSGEHLGLGPRGGLPPAYHLVFGNARAIMCLLLATGFVTGKYKT